VKVRDLARVQSYSVETRDGRIGRVAAVLPRKGTNGVLLVHSGGRSCRLHEVPFADVAAVDTRDRCVRLRPTVRHGAHRHAVRA
jgi:hypothetical protein